MSNIDAANDLPFVYWRSQPTYLWNPEGFDPVGYLGEPLHERADLARFVVHKIIWANVFSLRINKEGFANLKAEYLRKFFPGNPVYSEVMKSLLSGGAIVRDGHYIEGQKCFGYKLSPELAEMKQVRVEVTDPTLAKKIAIDRAEFRRSLKGVHRHLCNHLETVQIDRRAAIESLSTKEFLDVLYDPTYETSIQLIRDKQFSFHVCKYGRVHTNLTNLRSGLRKYLSAQGSPIVNLDIRNSQPQ